MWVKGGYMSEGSFCSMQLSLELVRELEAKKCLTSVDCP
jgi:hypothetical protein